MATGLEKLTIETKRKTNQIAVAVGDQQKCQRNRCFLRGAENVFVKSLRTAFMISLFPRQIMNFKSDQQ